MIEECTGDIFDSGAKAVVNTVNCVGVMGGGLAKQFKDRYPEMFLKYRKDCYWDAVIPGQMNVWDEGEFFIVNFPTKRHWRGKSLLGDVESGLVDLVQWCQYEKIDSIAIPPLGCGLGGLDWQDVRPLIEVAFEPVLEIRVLLFTPR